MSTHPTSPVRTPSVPVPTQIPPSSVVPSLPLSDTQLLHLCEEYGQKTKFWKQKFLGLLPEVNRRKLYEQKGCTSIYEFAAKLAGVSREQVQNACQLEEKFEDLPTLKRMLANGEVNINKLIRITSVVNSQNELLWAKHVQQLSHRALEVAVRDERQMGPSKSLHVQPQKPKKNDHSSRLNTTSFQLSPQLTQKIEQLQQKGINVNELLDQLLNQYEQDLKKETEELANEVLQEEAEKEQIGIPISRPIPAKVTRNLKNATEINVRDPIVSTVQ